MNKYGCIECQNIVLSESLPTDCLNCEDGFMVQIIEVSEVVPAAKVFRVAGMTDEITTCELCGRNELRGTVQMIELDADGNDVTDHYFGTSCAAKAAGWTQDDVKASVKAAEASKKEAKRLEREAAHKSENERFSAWCVGNFGTDNEDELWKIARSRKMSFARLVDDYYATVV
jgi:hypothetical protein